MIKVLKLTTYIILAGVFTALVGCATPADYKAMIVKPTATAQKNPKLAGAITVSNIIGGKKTNKMWTSQVDNESFKKALEGSLDAYGYLSSSRDKANYKLNAHLLSLKQPFAGFKLEVESAVEYKMFGPNETIYKHIVKASGSAGVSDAFYAPARLKLANEKAVQENIKGFLQYLSSF